MVEVVGEASRKKELRAHRSEDQYELQNVGPISYAFNALVVLRILYALPVWAAYCTNWSTDGFGYVKFWAGNNPVCDMWGSKFGGSSMFVHSFIKKL